MQLEEKSRLNLEAAQYLIYERNCYAPSVHCSYYACFQFLSFRLNEIGITYDKISKDINDSRKAKWKRTLHSHKYPINLVRKELIENVDKRFASQICGKINLLKKYREESDYQRKFIGLDQSEEAYNMSQEIIDVLKKNLK